MFVLKLARFFTRLCSEWKSAPIQNKKNFIRQSSRSYIVFTLSSVKQELCCCSTSVVFPSIIIKSDDNHTSIHFDYGSSLSKFCQFARKVARFSFASGHKQDWHIDKCAKQWQLQAPISGVSLFGVDLHLVYWSNLFFKPHWKSDTQKLGHWWAKLATVEIKT